MEIQGFDKDQKFMIKKMDEMVEEMIERNQLNKGEQTKTLTINYCNLKKPN